MRLTRFTGGGGDVPFPQKRRLADWNSKPLQEVMNGQYRNEPAQGEGNAAHCWACPASLHRLPWSACIRLAWSLYRRRQHQRMAGTVVGYGAIIIRVLVDAVAVAVGGAGDVAVAAGGDIDMRDAPASVPLLFCAISRIRQPKKNKAFLAPPLSLLPLSNVQRKPKVGEGFSRKGTFANHSLVTTHCAPAPVTIISDVTQCQTTERTAAGVDQFFD
jgi:hypothetical protein